MRRLGIGLTMWLLCFAAAPSGCRPMESVNHPRPGPVAAFEPTGLDAPGIENLYQLTPRLFSGSQPEGDASFSALRALGVKTIITVDGARPDVEAARAKSIRYIQLPIGYDAVPKEQAMLLAKAMKEADGPVYIHCHHGKHRGPAAAGICAIADGAMTDEQAIRWMHKAGTSKDYRGLFESVKAFRQPDAAALANATGPLPEYAAVPPMAQAMVVIDERWERLLAARKTGFQGVPDHPDIDPAHEALQLAEGFREMARQAEAKSLGEDFITRLVKADADTVRLHESIKELKKNRFPLDLLADVQVKADAVAASCQSCHVRYRN